jgi:hypothetical protein
MPSSFLNLPSSRGPFPVQVHTCQASERSEFRQVLFPDIDCSVLNHCGSLVVRGIPCIGPAARAELDRAQNLYFKAFRLIQFV